jgi:hypothetical protein
MSQISELVFVLRLQFSISSENDTRGLFSPLPSLSLRSKPRLWRYALLVELPLLQRERVMPEVALINRNDDGVFN